MSKGQRPTISFVDVDMNRACGKFSTSLVTEESSGHYVVESDLKGVAYVVDGKWIDIKTPRGSIRILRCNAEVIGKELLGVLEDVSELNLAENFRRRAAG